jgi:hypothetical protein
VQVDVESHGRIVCNPTNNWRFGAR